MKVDYIPSLDGIRAISVFIVLLSHAGLGHVIPGGLGVTTFFFLSGYLITTLLLAEYEHTHSIHFGHFYLRRFFRLFPPLIICLVLSYGLCLLGIVGGEASWQGFLAQVFYLANYHQILSWPGGTPMGTGVLWSLAVEEHFYLFFPIIIFLLFKYLPQRFMPYCFALLCLGVLVWRIYLVEAAGAPTSRVYYATDTRIDSILFGCILAVSFNPIGKPPKPQMAVKDWSILCVAGLLMILTLVYRNEHFRDTFRFSVQGIALMPLFYYCIRHSQHPIFAWLNYSWIKKLGVYSYVIYLTHHVILGVLQSQHNIMNPLINIVVAGCLSILLAYIIDRYIDIHFRALRKKFR